MKKVAFHTLGCKVNQYETEAMEEMFEKKRYKVVPFSDKADVYVVNTCTVTNVADKKSRQMLSKAKKNNPNAVIVAVGCYAQMAKEKLKEDASIDLVIGSNNKNKVADLVEEYLNEGNLIDIVEDIEKVSVYEDIWITNVKDKTRAYIKIQDGCNQFCSYCIIPYTRGRIRSRDEKSIVQEVLNLADKGYKEIVLTGIHIASYGKELEASGLIDLLTKVNNIKGIERIRIGSLEPTLINKEFIEKLVQLKKVCPHFHLSLQSGCDSTLKRMNRKYTTNEYFESVKLIRHYYKHPAITTDIIVGFPGETEEEFNCTLEFIKKVKFNSIHVFKYSKREGTPAAKRHDQVDPSKKNIRSNDLISLQEIIKKEVLTDLIDTKVDVLFEEQLVENGNCYYTGLTDNYCKVKVKSNQDLNNKLLTVQIIDIEDDMLIGNLIN